MSTYDQGALVTLTYTTTAPDGTPVDATSVAVSVVAPNGTTSSPAVVHDGVGNYHALQDTTGGAPGTWLYRWTSTGTAQAADDGSFVLRAATIPPAAALVSVSDYQRITKDLTSEVSDVVAALAEAQQLVEEHLGRPLASEERTESLFVFPSGLVYPAATPITAVTTPAGAAIEGNGIKASSMGAWGSWSGYDGPGLDPQSRRATVTYTGGYTAATLPATIRREICRAVRAALSSPVLASALPANVKSASVGDVSLTGGANGLAFGVLLDATATTALRGYKRRQVRA